MSERVALIVEDSSTMRQLITLALRRIPGLSFVEVGDGAEALTAMATRRFDVLLVDINMPVMGGFALLERLADKADRPAIIVITTESAVDDRERAKKLGADEYVTKPVRAPELVAVVTRVLERRPPAA